MNMKRMRGRNHRPNGGGGGSGSGGFRNQQNGIPLNRNHVFDSSGPEMRVRGTAQQLYEKYQQMARDVSSNGDRVLGEAYYQHAEHYFRIISAINQAQGLPNTQPPQTQGGQQPGQGQERGNYQPQQGNQGEYQRRDSSEGEQQMEPRQENRQQEVRQQEPRRFEQRPYEQRQKPEFQRQDRQDRPERQDRQDRPERQPRAEPVVDMRIDISSALEAELAAAAGEHPGMGAQPVIVPVAVTVKPAPVPAVAPAPDPKPIPIVAEAPPLVLTPVEAPRVPRPRGRPRLIKPEAAKVEE